MYVVAIFIAGVGALLALVGLAMDRTADTDVAKAAAVLPFYGGLALVTIGLCVAAVRWFA